LQFLLPIVITYIDIILKLYLVYLIITLNEQYNEACSDIPNC